MNIFRAPYHGSKMENRYIFLGSQARYKNFCQNPVRQSSVAKKCLVKICLLVCHSTALDLHHVNQLRGTLKSLGKTRHCGIEGFKDGPQLGRYYVERH